MARGFLCPKAGPQEAGVYDDDEKGRCDMRRLTSVLAAAALAAAFAFAGTAYADQPIGGMHCGGTQVSHPCTVQGIMMCDRTLVSIRLVRRR